MAPKKKAAVKKPAGKQKKKSAAEVTREDLLNSYDQEQSAGATIDSDDGETVPCAENETTE